MRHQSNHHPSFSSTLLDTMYRSMDEDAYGGPSGGPRMEGSRPVTAEAAAMRSATVVERRAPSRRGDWSSATLASTSSRSSLSAAGPSSYDSAALDTPPPPRPIRTGDPPRRTPKQSTPEGRKKTTGGSTRFRASEFYGALQKTKPPVSPGARLARFLTSLFAGAGKRKKEKTPTAAISAESGPSSESSRSLSCFVETPSSSSGAAKRSVRPSPPGDLVGEELTPLAAVSVGEAPSPAAEGRKRPGDATRELFSGSREKMGIEEEEQEVDDRMSCSSSDLFELENLEAIDGGGGEKGYLGELPVYGTTHLATNRAIARGLLILQGTGRKS